MAGGKGTSREPGPDRASRWATAALLALVLAAVSASPVGALESPAIAWTQRFGTADTETVFEVVQDATGVYVAGVTWGAFPGYPLERSGSAFLGKFDFDGNEQWIRQFGTLGRDEAHGVAVDGAAAYVVGLWGVTFGVVRRYDPNGGLVWEDQFLVQGYTVADDVAVDPTGVYVTGRTKESRTSAEDFDVFLRKYDATGGVLWTREFGSPEADLPEGIVAVRGAVYVAGSTNGSLSGFVNMGLNDTFVQKYGPNGDLLWTEQFGSSAEDWGFSVATDGINVYVAGMTWGALPGQSSGGGRDAFVRKYDPSDQVVWTRQFGSDRAQGAFGVAADATSVYAAGYTLGPIPGRTFGVGGSFVRKYDAAGNEVWTLQFSPYGGASGAFAGVAVGPGGVFVAGDVLLPSPVNPEGYLVKVGIGVEAGPCPRSQGFWKNHADAWPVDSLVLGSTSYDKSELLSLLRRPTRGDASLILARQLIAAKLSVANGTDARGVVSTLADADRLLSAYAGELPYGVRPTVVEGQAMTAVAETLDAYNSGDQTPGCQDWDGVDVPHARPPVIPSPTGWARGPIPIAWPR